MTFVCRVDGATLVESRAGRLVHVGDVPKETPEHDPDPVPAEAFRAAVDRATDLKAAAEEMYAHHVVAHPASECLFAQRLELAIRAS